MNLVSAPTRARCVAGMFGMLLGAARPECAGAQALSPFAANVTSGWRLSAGIGQLWESNVRFRDTASVGDLTTRANVFGAGLWRSALGHVALEASGTVVRFQRLTALNQSAYDLALRGERRLGRRAIGSLALELQSDVTDRSLIPEGDGTLLGALVTMRSNAASGALAYRAAPHVTISGGARYQTASFSDPTLAGGRLAVVSGELARQQTRTTDIGLAYELRRSSSGGRTVDAHQLAGRLGRRVGERLTAQLLAGVSTAHSRDAATPVELTGEMTLALRTGRGQWSADARRTVGQVFGNTSSGLFTSELLGGGYVRRLSRQLVFDAHGREGWNTPLAVDLPAVRSREGTVGLRYTLPTGLDVAVGVFARRRDDLRAVSNNGVTVGFGYGWSQLRGSSGGTAQ
jgi:hypothetical protein